MGIQKMKQDFWIRTIGECKSSGKTVHAFCEDNNLSEKSYWYYHKKYGDVLQNALQHEQTNPIVCVPEQNFVELRRPEKQTIQNVSITVNGIKLEIPEGISDEFLQKLIRSVSNA